MLVERRGEEEDEPVVARGPGARRRRPSRAPPGRGSAAPESTAHDCAIESMRHSAFAGRAERRAVVEVGAPVPVAVPGRRARARSRSASPCARQLAPRAPARRARRPMARTRPASACRNHPSQTLSPRPAWPTRFMPSFQSPCPISGRPWLPDREAPVERARAVLEEGGALGRDGRARSRTSACSGASGGPSRNGTTSSSTRGVAGDLDVVRRRRRAARARSSEIAGAHAAARPAGATSAGRRPRRTAGPRRAAGARARRPARRRTSAMTSWSWSRKP